MSAAVALLTREVRLAMRAGGGTVQSLVFFVIVTLFVPLGGTPEPERLAGLAPGTLWLAALLACLLSLDRLFQSDFEDGSLEALARTPLPLEAVVALKVLAHWLTTGLPLTLIAPLLALTLHLPGEAIPWLIVGLLIGTPALSLIGAIGAALTLGLRRGGLLIGVITLPLYVPTLIYGAATASESPGAALPLLGAMTLFGAALAPFAVAHILRLQLR
ncbi:MAG: heme exporter protein CcmB [Pseudomonadota bacterium]